MSFITEYAFKARDRLVYHFKTMNKEKFLYKTLPAVGNVSYLLHSTKFLAPNIFSSICGEQSLNFSNAILVNSLFGNVLYLINCKHMSKTSAEKAIGFAVFSSVMFNFGSVLFWSFTKNYLPDNEKLLALYGILSGVSLLYIAKSYIKLIEKPVDNFNDTSLIQIEAEASSNDDETQN